MIHGIRPSDSAALLVKNGQTEKFHQQFGDCYIQGIGTGASYYAVLELMSRSEEEHRQIGDSLNFTHPAFIDSTSFSKHLEHITENSFVKISSFRVGGYDAGPKANITVDQIIERVTNFTHEISNSSIPIKAFIEDYKTLGFPDPHDSTQIQTRALVLRHFSLLRDKLLNKLGDIHYIQDHPGEFEDIEKCNLDEARQKAQDWPYSINQNAVKCANFEDQCSTVLLKIETIDLPVRKNTFVTRTSTTFVITIDISGTDVNEANEWISELANVYADLQIFDTRGSERKITFKASFNNPRGSEEILGALRDIVPDSRIEIV